MLWWKHIDHQLFEGRSTLSKTYRRNSSVERINLKRKHKRVTTQKLQRALREQRWDQVEDLYDEDETVYYAEEE